MSILGDKDIFIIYKQNTHFNACHFKKALVKICGNKPQKPLYVDHCHETKKIRGLLCHQCNVALGHMNDDPQRLEKAISYLKESCAA